MGVVFCFTMTKQDEIFLLNLVSIASVYWLERLLKQIFKNFGKELSMYLLSLLMPENLYQILENVCQKALRNASTLNEQSIKILAKLPTGVNTTRVCTCKCKCLCNSHAMGPTTTGCTTF